MSDYIIGGWTQDLKNPPNPLFSYTMYGMITNLAWLTSGPPTSEPPPSWCWSPKEQHAPSSKNSKVLWTYGGGGAGHKNMPATSKDVSQIISAANINGWQGVDFDDESQMNVNNIINAMQDLGQGKSTSYTFLAGWDYNNPDQSSEGKTINDNVAAIAKANVCDRFNLMCYGAAMWDMPTIKANVPAAVDRTIKLVGDCKKVVLALTPAGLNNENLDFFLEQVTSKHLGGLFIWNYTELSNADLNKITSTLGIK
ncbi:hypothetical protein [Zooshikella ganghwensis]|uniref:hypothetical protein n=1 Tax=Zooshikella ganghwensis TaxID=202772 RepID=UPI0004154F5E|nr:hypothetical protein [Zooshikella ganghwensis]